MRGDPIRLSVVSPVYQAADCLDEFVERVSAAAARVTGSYEIILVDDGSIDASWARIEDLARRDSRLRGVRLSRNFGQHLAIAAGLSASRGSLVVVMDCDLQDPPELIPELVQKAGEGYDVVSTVRRSRSASWFRRAMSRSFYFLARVLSSPHVRPNSNTLSLLSRKVVEAYLRTFDRYSPYPFIVNWLGFRCVAVEIDHAPRAAGSSSYTVAKLVRFAVNGLVSQSTRLLHISTVIGLLFSLLSVAQIVFIVYLKLTRPVVLPGWASVMAVLWLVGGTILFSLGVIGLYLTRMFEQTRDRPFFIVGETTSEAVDTEGSSRGSVRRAGSRLFEDAEN
jgi:dolichol-phosphate mannosyltransferase